MAPTALAQAQNVPIQLFPVDPPSQRRGPRGGPMLPCLETPDPHQLTLPGKRLSATIGAVAVADADLMVVKLPS